MGEKIKTSMDWLKTAKLTPIQLFYVIIVIFYFVFTQTSIYDAIPDFIQTVVFVIIVVIGVLLGVSFLNAKKIALEMKAIYEDVNLTPLQKVNAYGNLALIILTKLGKAFELLNEEQFINTYKKPEPEEPIPPIII